MPIPLHVLTGFLGTGKTTLLRRLLEQPGEERFAVLVNEVGALALDHLLLERVDDDISVLSSGCLCCSLRGALPEAVERLLALSPTRIVVETTGLADPAPLVHGLVHHARLADAVTLANVVATLDAVRGEELLAEQPEASRQLAFADRVVITKADLAPERAHALRSLALERAPGAEVCSAVHGDAPRAWLLDPAPLPRARSSAGAERWLHFSLEGQDVEGPAAETHVLTLPDAVHLEALSLWLRLVTQLDGPRLLRIKGLVEDRGSGGLFALQSAQHAVSPPRLLAERPAGWVGSRLVVITRGMPAGPLARLLASAGEAATGSLRGAAPSPSW